MRAPFGVMRKEVCDHCGVGARALHPERQRLQRARQLPARMRIELDSDGANSLQIHGRAENRADNQIAVAAHKFGQGIERQIRAVAKGRLKNGPEQGVAAAHRRARVLTARDVLRHSPHQNNVDDAVHWV